MAVTHQKISTQTVGSGGVSAVTFTSIPQTYTDLVVYVSFRSAASGTNSGSTQVTFNGDSGANYSFVRIYGDGSAVGQGGSTGTSYIRVGNNNPSAGNGAGIFGNIRFYIYNYAGSNQKNTSEENVGENNATTRYIQQNAGLWASTSAITSITFTGESGNIAEFSTFSLYGIKNT